MGSITTRGPPNGRGRGRGHSHGPSLSSLAALRQTADSIQHTAATSLAHAPPPATVERCCKYGQQWMVWASMVEPPNLLLVEESQALAKGLARKPWPTQTGPPAKSLEAPIPNLDTALSTLLESYPFTHCQLPIAIHPLHHLRRHLEEAGSRRHRVAGAPNAAQQEKGPMLAFAAERPSASCTVSQARLGPPPGRPLARLQKASLISSPSGVTYHG